VAEGVEISPAGKEAVESVPVALVPGAVLAVVVRVPVAAAAEDSPMPAVVERVPAALAA
jgi:hypothetical protein